jgi:hypothetical protein
VPIELMGQGEPLPPDFPYEGEWILCPRMFLYLPQEPSPANPSVPQFTVRWNIGQENWSFGFDVTRLATAFGTTADAIREANRRGGLTLENVFANTPGGENATKKIYVFGYAGKTIDMTVEQLTQVGQA